jgi:hypothetical protein
MTTSFESQTNMFGYNIHFNNKGITGFYLHAEILIMALILVQSSEIGLIFFNMVCNKQIKYFKI